MYTAIKTLQGSGFQKEPVRPPTLCLHSADGKNVSGVQTMLITFSRKAVTQYYQITSMFLKESIKGFTGRSKSAAILRQSAAYASKTKSC
ncbi:hypothetical protein FKM82_001942 [Ascaphus truei]